MLTLGRIFRSNSVKPKRIVVITDPGRDPDDEVLFAQLAGLTRLGFVRVVGVIVNQTPLDDRARLAKATFNVFSNGMPSGPFDVKALMVKAHLKALGLQNVPVSMGTEGDVSHKLRPYEFQLPYLHLARNEHIGEDGQVLLKGLMEDAVRDNERISLLLVSGMKDADIFIQANPDLSKAALEPVEIMGGIHIDSGALPVLDMEGLLQPDDAANNKFGCHENDDPKDPVSKYARSLYRTLQKLEIPTDVVTRHAAYAAEVPGSYYTKLANTGHPVGIRLRDMQKSAIAGLFEDVTREGGHPNKRLTPQWFADTFLKDPENDLAVLLQSTDDIMDRIKGFKPYDPMTVLNIFFPHAFAPYAHDKGNMRVVGLSPQQHGIADVPGVHRLLEYLPRVGFGIEPAFAWKNALSTLGLRKIELPADIRKLAA